MPPAETGKKRGFAPNFALVREKGGQGENLLK